MSCVGLLMCSECLIELDKVLGKPGKVLVAHPKVLLGKVGFRRNEKFFRLLVGCWLRDNCEP